MPRNMYEVLPGETKEQYRARIGKLQGEAHAKQRRDLKSGATKVVMDADDLGFLLPGYEDLVMLKKSLPNLRITAFTIPLSKEFFNSESAKHFSWEKYRKWAEIINQHDWIEVAVHGFAHTHHECACNYPDAIMMIEAVEKLFERVGLRYSKIWKAPYWQYSWDFLVALKDKGYTIAIDRNHPRPVPNGAKVYEYNWSFEEEAIPQGSFVKGHGHFYGRNSNNITDCLGRILKALPTETQFLTIGEYLVNSPIHHENGEGQESSAEGRRESGQGEG